MFLQDKNFPASGVFDDTVWLSQLAYLSDIFSRMNELNLGLQGLSTSAFDVQDKISAMLKKLELFEIKIRTGDVSAFPNLETFLSDNDLRLADQVRDNIAEHLKSLRQQFAEYFPAIAQGNTWMRDPFVIKASDVLEENLSALEQELLIELSCDDTLKSTFRGQTLLNFWMQRRSEYPALSDKAVHFLIPFATTYLCEKGFFSLDSIKTKHRSRLDAEPSLRLKLTAIDPDIVALCSQSHAHPSH